MSLLYPISANLGSSYGYHPSRRSEGEAAYRAVHERSSSVQNGEKHKETESKVTKTCNTTTTAISSTTGRTNIQVITRTCEDDKTDEAAMEQQ